MITAYEAYKIAHENDMTEKKEKEVINVLFPPIDKTIRDLSKDGFYSAFFKAESLQALLPIELRVFFTKKQILNILVNEMCKKGYTVKIPESCCSITFKWRNAKPLDK